MCEATLKRLHRQFMPHKSKLEDESAEEIRVIGAGLPRTGTSSLKAALEILGFGPCHHMSELFDKPDQGIEFARAYDGEKVDFRSLLKGYGSTVDVPTMDFYKDIHKLYPKAKIILSVRDTDDVWFESYHNTVGQVGVRRLDYYCVYLIRFLRLPYTVAGKCSRNWSIKYGGIGPWIHKKHNAQVIKETRPDQLLVFNAKQGWASLCKFLNVDIPERIPFPNVNDTKHIKRGIRMGLIMGACSWALLIGIVLLGLYLVRKWLA